MKITKEQEIKKDYADRLKKGTRRERIMEKEEIKKMVQEHLYLQNKDKGVLDTLQEKVVSRKLLVFLTATLLMVCANLDPDIWGMIAVCYIGGQASIDFAKSWKHGG